MRYPIPYIPTLNGLFGVGIGNIGRSSSLLFDWYPGSGVYDSGRGPTPTHSRDSGATLVDDSGNVVWADENLAPESEDFSFGWTISRASKAPSIDMPAGASAAIELSETNATANTHYMRRTDIGVIDKTGTFHSFALKQSGRRYAFIAKNYGGGSEARVTVYDLQEGVVTDFGTEVTDSGIIDRGDGWFECWMTTDNTTQPQSDVGGSVGPDTEDIFYDGIDSLVSILISESMISRASAYRPYISNHGNDSALYLPRISHDSDGLNPFYLHEPQATNLDADSHDAFGVGTSSGSVSLVGTVASPSGETDGQELDITSVANNIGKIITVAASTDYVYSFWAKKGTALDLKYSVYNYSTTADLIPRTSYFSQLASGDWERVSVAFTTPVGATQVKVYTTRDSAVGTFSVWGNQLELGTVPTSIIPTYGASAIRQADMNEVTGTDFSDLWNETEGTLVFEGEAIEASSTSNLFVLNSSNARRFIYISRPGVGTSSEIIAFYDGTNLPQMANDVRLDEPFKVALALDASNDVRSSFNSAAIVTETQNGNLLTAVAQLQFFANHGGKITRVRYYKKALSDSKLITLTT